MRAVDLRRPRLLSPRQARSVFWRRAAASLLAVNLLTAGAGLALTAAARRIETALPAQSSPGTPRPEELAARRQALQARLSLLAPLENFPSWGPLLHAVSTTGTGRLTVLAVTGTSDAGGLALQVAGDAPDLAAVDEYMRNLQQVAGVRVIRFEHSARQPEGPMRFRISLTIARAVTGGEGP